MKKEKKSFPFSIIISVLVLAVMGVGCFMLFRDTTPPAITIQPESETVGLATKFTVTVQDSFSGIKNVEAVLISGNNTIPIFSQKPSRTTQEVQENFTLKKGVIPDGPFTIRVSSRDNSLYPFGRAGKSSISKSFTLDSKPPKIYVMTHTTNINQGGSGLVAFALSENVEKAGIQVGKRFFPAYRQAAEGDKNVYYCLFAMPWDTPPAAFKPLITVADKAGNTASRGFPYHANARHFRADRINLSDAFMERTVPEFSRYDIGNGSPLEQYLTINNKVRTMNRAQLVQLGLDTADEILWKGAFVRLPNAANRARFADQRDYYYKGKKVDHQTHLGIDLASIRQAKVPAANEGIVVFADFHGIYGNCVIIDHGLGLQTLYAHLSSIAVAQNDNVSKGQIIGRTGTSGLAGGDHLHYGVILSGTPVQPIEWWDAHWIKNNITSKLQ
ncbi:M23 family metallopeptidase [Pseudodesulfovibrio senegalensis]|jgi:murein DD-endopeptidase MepM/ murein hydrolase activator NlpD|uniref:M23 family metallopeptidase n=1 Tax=Pseudodesulfovibrio senegalensis TaxID=1721087 RepID=A0A6N6N3H6_9BACT|nr:M23 family metallopeptidase [Pseudodesulfovibrio senegalensis]KAB1441228.1 M23 family metallopeptidase [Pseudodesulfovibrio senegalensis]